MFINQSSGDLKFLAGAILQGQLRPPFSEISLARLGMAGTPSIAKDLSVLHSEQFTSEQIATVLQSLAAEREKFEVVRSTIEIVATGPDPSERARDTAVVIEEMFREADTRALIVGFALYQGREIFKTIAAHMDAKPNLSVTCCFDISRQRLDTSRDTDIVDRFANRFVKNEWPGRRLPEVYYDPRGLSMDARARAVLHAKTIVVDGKKAIVTSANPTRAAYVRNIELGVVLNNEDIATRIERHFYGLIREGYLHRAPIENFARAGDPQ